MDREMVLDKASEAEPVPLVVAVTGHRDLVESEIPELRRIVCQFLQSVRENCGTTPVVVMSPLAEGSDQLVASEALKLGLRLIAPLPMNVGLYRAGFADDKGRHEFDRLSDQAEVFELPLLPENTLHSIARPGPAQDRQYAQLGIYLSAHCHLLLAIWDGKPSERLGGTAQVVHYHHTDYMPGLTPGRSRARHLISDFESDLVYHVVCSRDRSDGAPRADLKPLESFYLTADPDNPQSAELPRAYRLMFRRTCAFNNDMYKYRRQILQHQTGLLEDAIEANVHVRPTKVAALYRTADFLAAHFQVRTHLMLRSTYTLAALMGLAFIFYADLEGFDYMIFVFLLLFVLGLVLWLIATKREWQRKYLDYRSLAEGLRVQFYWLLAGVTSQTVTEFAHDNFLQKQEVELGWIRNAMRSSTVGPQEIDRGRASRDLEYAIDRWIGDSRMSGEQSQIAYFKHQQDRRLLTHMVTTTLGFVCLSAGIGVTVFLALRGATLTDPTRDTLLVLMGVLPLAAAVREAYAHKKADKELIKQYRFMYRLFRNARMQLDAADTDAEKREVLHALGEAALDEHAEWILVHRGRPLEHSWI